MLLLCGLATACQGFCRLFPGGERWAFHAQFEHVRWEGLHAFDLVFPFFIFIAGASFPYSHARQIEKGLSSTRRHLRILKRVVLLCVLGWVYGGRLLGGDFANFSFLHWTVLGIIGFAWGTAAFTYLHAGIRTRLIVVVLLLVGYWAALRFVAPDAPPGATSFSAEGWILGAADRQGFPSWIPLAMFGYSTSAFFGMFAGEIVRSAREGFSSLRKVGALTGFGIALLAFGLALEPTCPLIKNIWTPSYALVSGGLAFLVFALFYFIIDVRGCGRWCFPLEVVGANAIVAYMLPRLIDFEKASKFFFGSLANLCPTPDFVLACGQTLLVWTVLWFLYRNRTFMRV